MTTAAESATHPTADAGAGRASIRRLLLAAGAIGLGLALSLRLWPYQIDDSYIFYRYARNLLDGHGLRFNPGGDPVEGFSSPVWLAALCALGWFGDRASLPALAGSLGLACATLLALVLAREDRGRRVGAGWAACAAWCLCPTAVFYAASGMEEPLFVLAVVIAHGAGPGGSDAVRRGVLSLSAWLRPEAPWIAVSLSAQRMLTEGRRSLLSRRHLLDLAALVAGGATLLAARLALFGAVFPNTARAKEPRWLDALAYVAGTFAEPWALVLAAFAGLGALAGGGRYRGFLLAGTLWAVAAVLEGGDWMPAHRLLAPSLALLALAAAGVVCAEDPATGNPLLARAGLGLAMLAAVLGADASWSTVAMGRNTFDGVVRENRALIGVVRELELRSVALVDIGELGFELPAVEIFDLGGLTDAEVARAPGGLLRKRFDLDLLYGRRRPDAIVYRVPEEPPLDAEGRPTVDADALRTEVERHVRSDPRATTAYVPWLAVVPAAERRPYYGRVLYLRADLAKRARAPAERVLRVPPPR